MESRLNEPPWARGGTIVSGCQGQPWSDWPRTGYEEQCAWVRDQAVPAAFTNNMTCSETVGDSCA
jgi:hypothetical protein